MNIIYISDEKSRKIIKEIKPNVDKKMDDLASFIN